MTNETLAGRATIFRFALFLITMVSVTGLAVLVHERLHLVVLRILGGQGEIVIPHPALWFTRGLAGQPAMYTSVEPTSHAWLVSLAGGWGTALIFPVLWFGARLGRARWNHFPFFAIECASCFVIFSSFFYAPTELLLDFNFSPESFFLVAGVAISIGTVPVLILYTKRVGCWVKYGIKPRQEIVFPSIL